ncbi:MAG: ATPase [Peptoniphilus sp. oral taxon 375]|uniref:ATPase n=1 Tax=Urinicoccus timonensis TaxID=2024205 RepID=UPI00021A2C10|nr:ATPase [Urinicoccus timonensis]EGS29693.1 hypothetical protein HMPREF9130_2059 [Peptoniphilus sp. oral taxon 375 str. F0436]MBS4871263.1 ATPase [Peptoniphilus sp. oral taxon 375]
MDVLKYVDDLEDIVETSSTIPLTGKIMVEKEEILDILENLRRDLPLELTEATQIRKDKDLIIKDAHKEAEKIIQGAKAQADQLVAEDELVRKANARAQELMDTANEESNQIRTGARDYADKLLEQTQVQLSDVIKLLNENRQELK